MSDEQQEILNQDDEQQEILNQDTVDDIAIQEGIEAIKRIHAIERQMLSRAVQNLCNITQKSAEEIVTVLAEGLDEDYENAMKAAYASSGLISNEKKVLGANKRSLYVPGK